MDQRRILDSRSLRFVDTDLERAYQREGVVPVRREAFRGAVASVALWLIGGMLIPLAGLLPVATSTPIVVLMAGANVVVLVPIRRMQTLDDALRILLAINALTTIGLMVLVAESGQFARYAGPAVMLQSIFAVYIARRFLVSIFAVTVQLVVLVAVAVLLGVLRTYILDLFIVVSAVGVGVAATYVIESTTRTDWQQRRVIEAQGLELAAEKAKSDRLLRNVLPDSIADRLREREATIADRIADATVLFADLVGFTPLAGRLSPEATVEMLDVLFGRFDELADRFGVAKIKTIGDAYMAAGGVPDPLPDHPDRVVRMGLAMLEATHAYAAESGLPLALRIGIHSGSVVGGVIGHRRLSYDLWGDTVNVASRMESNGVAGSVQVSRATRDRLQDRYHIERRGIIEVKGKGPIEAFFVTGDV
jgi:class 3 adenylate cyclase